MAEREVSVPSQAIVKARGHAAQSFWSVAVVMNTILSVFPGTTSLRGYLFGQVSVRRKRRTARRRTHKTLVRKVVTGYLPRNKAGDLRGFPRVPQPAHVIRGPARRGRSRQGSVAEAEQPSMVATLRDVAHERTSIVGISDELHEFASSRICTTSPPPPVTSPPELPEPSPPAPASSSDVAGRAHGNADELADILAALQLLVTDEHMIASEAVPSHHMSKGMGVTADQQKAAEQLAALMAGIAT